MYGDIWQIGGGGRRKAPRAAAPQLAVLSTVTADHRAALVNISRIGARFSAPNLPGRGEELIFRADNVQSFGRVVWSDGGQCGVAFEAPLATAEVDRLRSHADDWIFAGLSIEQAAAAEEWDLGLGP